MKAKTKANFAGILGIVAMFQASAAQAANPANCLTRPELRGMIAYMLPFAIDSIVSRCATSVPSGSYLATAVPRMSSELKRDRAKNWPMARQAFAKFGGDSQGSAAVLAALPEETMRPIMEAIVAEELTKAVKDQQCGDIDRVLAPLSPLSAANYVEFITELAVVGSRGNAKMQVCTEG